MPILHCNNELGTPQQTFPEAKVEMGSTLCERLTNSSQFKKNAKQERINNSNKRFREISACEGLGWKTILSCPGPNCDKRRQDFVVEATARAHEHFLKPVSVSIISHCIHKSLNCIKKMII